jgi:hypothetical protein
MRFLRYLGIGILLAALLLPWGAYWVGLRMVSEYPVPTSPFVSAQQRAWLWSQTRGAGELKLMPSNPYAYLYQILQTGNQPSRGLQIAGCVARAHLANQQDTQRMIFWHLSSAALTIWLTRNWSEEQIIASAYECLQQ